MSQVVEEILARCASRREEKDDYLQSNEMCPDGCRNNERLRKALVSLCQDALMDNLCRLRPKFERIASEICKKQGKSFKYFKSLLV